MTMLQIVGLHNEEHTKMSLHMSQEATYYEE